MVMIEMIQGDVKKVNEEKRAVRGLIVKEGKLMLMYLRSSNTYVLPGGGVDAHETLDEAIKREIKEETGYNLLDYEKALEIKEYFDDKMRHHFIYRCDVGDHKGPVNLTKEEKALGMEMVTVPIEKGLELLRDNQGTHPLSEPVQLREFIAVMHGLKT